MNGLPDRLRRGSITRFSSVAIVKTAKNTTIPLMTSKSAMLKKISRL